MSTCSFQSIQNYLPVLLHEYIPFTTHIPSSWPKRRRALHLSHSHPSSWCMPDHYSVHVSPPSSHLSHTLENFCGLPRCVYINFLYGKVLFTSLFQSCRVGAIVLIHTLATTFLAINNASLINMVRYLSTSMSGRSPNRQTFGSRPTGDPILSCKKRVTCNQYACMSAHSQIKW